MKLQVIAYNSRVEFLPLRKPAELRGLLKGLEPVIERESSSCCRETSLERL
jgi:hypothetical protein